VSVEIVRIATFDGPNRFDPRSGVLARLRAGYDYSDALRAALKDAAQRIGLVIGNPRIESRRTEDAVWHELFFVTPAPALGADMVRYVVALLNAQHTGDETWDADSLLWDLQKKRRAEALPLPALQLMAEASARGVPSFVRRDGLLQIGYGARGHAIDPALFRERKPAPREADIGIGSSPFALSDASSLVPWSRLGVVPVVAISGGATSAATAALGSRLGQQRGGVAIALIASFDTARNCLIDPAADVIVLDLDPVDLLWRGLPVDRCLVSALLDLPEELASEAGGRDDLARALGVALLVTASDGRGVLNADDPAILALAEYAPCPLILMARSGEHPALRAHRAAGGSALFLRRNTIVLAHGPAETMVTLTPDDDPWQTLTVMALHLAFGEAHAP
jgi:hypothetical protein